MLTGRDLDGNTWDARKITNEEYEKIAKYKDASRSGAKRMLLLDDGYAGIAFPKSCESNVMYYGGLEYSRGHEDIVVSNDGDNERYVAWIFDKMEEAHYDSEYYERFGRAFDKTTTNVWDFLGPILDPTWFDEDLG